jgi:hypothetical protein
MNNRKQAFVYLSGGLMVLTAESLTRPLAADSFYTVTPCRILDTRSSNSPLPTNIPTVFGVTGICGIPAAASSVSFNVTLVPQTVSVDLGMCQGDLSAVPGTNVVSSQGAIAAAAAVAPLSNDGQGTVRVIANSVSMGATDLILDVNGYFASSSPGGLAQLYAQGGDGDPADATDPLADPTPPNSLGQVPDGFDPTETPLDIGSLIAPLRQDRATKRYFYYGSGVVSLVGVSADAACHLHHGNGYDMCTFTSGAAANYIKVLDDAAAKNLNKIRLWVSLNGGDWQANKACVALPPDPSDQPFKYYAPGSSGFPTQNPLLDGIGYWNLDEENLDFFANLKTVVNYASSKGIFVEVTFFAPWIGIWELSPWNPRHGRLSTDASHTIGVGFTDRGYFVQLDTSNGGNNQNERMRQYQYKVIDWTIQALAGFDHIYWEIANEPEDGRPQATCGFPTPGVAPVGGAVIPWHQKMITEVTSYEVNNYVTPHGNLAYPHLIAVQPFTVNGTTPYLPVGNSGNVTVINGHYTMLGARAEGVPSVGGGVLGAIVMARTYAGTGGILIASNEDKISGGTTMFPWGGQGETCGWDFSGATEDCLGEEDSLRAQAWEFMLDLGAAYDHFGYYWNSTYGQMVRHQMGALRTFLAGLPLRQLVTSPDPFAGNGPVWVKIGPSPYSDASGKNRTKFWAAMQPTSTTTPGTYVLYIHHSQPRLKSTGGFLDFGGYQPVYSSSNGPSDPQQYTEKLVFCLTPQNTKYSMQWIDPSTGGPIGGPVPWSDCNTPVDLPKYSFDIALKVTPAQ